MESSTIRVGEQRTVAVGLGQGESPVAAISWAAIIGGAFAIGSISLILLALGAGFGFASVSPWSNSNPSATTFGVVAAIWLVVVQWLSAAFGGYLTGRLRTRWVSVPSDEIYFRDTAHGFLAWAVASVLTAALLASSLSTLIGGAARMTTAASATPAASGSAAAPSATSSALDPTGYLVAELFRTDHPQINSSPQPVRAEATPIIAHGLAVGEVPAADQTYLTQLVAARTGLAQPDAAKRVGDVSAQVKADNLKARQVADKTRKAAAYLSFFTAFSMIIGAFIAAVSATVAGHRRDEVLASRRPLG